jgi:hypothetical protein
VLLHGLSAAPLANRYAAWFHGHPGDRRPALESSPVAAPRPRGLGVAGVNRTG